MNSILNLFHSHRSIRSYKNESIDSQELMKILEASSQGASSSGNLTPYSIIITKDYERKNQLFDLHFEQMMVKEAPVVLTFCADFNRTRKWLKLRGARDNFDNFLAFLEATVDASLVSQNVALACEAKGWGICYMGTTWNSCDKLQEFFNLPDSVIPITSMVIGVPAESPEQRNRLPIAGLIHEEIYKDYDDEAITAFYKEKEVSGWERYRSYLNTKDLIEKHQIKNLAEYYTSDLKYDPKSFRIDSKMLLELLKKRGFMNHDDLN